MLQVANLAKTKCCIKTEKTTHGYSSTHGYSAEITRSYPMNTNMTRFRWFFENLAHSCDLDESSFSIGRLMNSFCVNLFLPEDIHDILSDTF